MLIDMLELACSMSSLLQHWLYGGRGIKGPIWGLFTAVIWTTFSVVTEHWLLMPLNIFAFCIHGANVWRMADPETQAKLLFALGKGK
jgi:hypothetical protein